MLFVEVLDVLRKLSTRHPKLYNLTLDPNNTNNRLTLEAKKIVNQMRNERKADSFRGFTTTWVPGQE